MTDTPAADYGAEYVVVGAGSGGCAVAGRLAEAGRDVLLLEAGPDHGPFDLGRWPAELIDARALALTHDWGYAQDRWLFHRARVVGGCSSHNGAIAAVGHRADYDRWNLPGWSGSEVERVYARVLDTMRVRTYGAEEVGPFHARCLDAARAAGWRIASDLCDLDANDSFGLETVNVHGTTRWNAAFAYLDGVRDAGSLRIVDDALADRFDPEAHVLWGERAGVGLRVEYGTLVLAAGVYGSPAILQRSGVGDPQRLARAGVRPRVDLPGVGRNLHDHPMVHADRRVGPELQRWLDEAAASGFLPEEQTLGKAVSSHATDGLYDLHVFPVCASNQTSALHGKVHIEVACVTPRSRGEVGITAAHPAAPLHIDHRYLSDPEGHDLAVLRDGLALAEELFAQPALASVLGERITDMSTDDAIRDHVEHYYHPAGTCAMRDGEDAVCDGRGKVRGLEDVHVADISIVPWIPRANTNLPAVMIGERIAELLLARVEAVRR